LFWKTLGGPVRASYKKGIKFNKWSWIKFANIVLVDWPFGTGYSRPKDHIDYLKHNTWLWRQSARFNKFVERFFEEFPAYNKSDLWYSGDSSTGTTGLPLVRYAIKHKLFNGR